MEQVNLLGKRKLLTELVAEIVDLFLPNGCACPFKDECGPGSECFVYHSYQHEEPLAVITCHTPIYKFSSCYKKKKNSK